ncbi:hypothetical protein G1H11_23260 [Phytoactinopolyspora alkaliphila]|uniref:Uncharacterized protein n=1 Tax=Phytoactinopolyspora alkaliphila TaxID=1783498 RepID=A0A6N9YT52_9ACTN|nr:hypothetical protein [Phytoactinopolyspora alkaliphila]NED98223.1 hypothetical protein [Phytoactinopolyspora alkaliphila]
MHIVNKHLNPATAPLLAPSESGYLLLAAEIDRRPMFLPGSANQRQLIAHAKTLAAALERDDDVVRATVFRGFAHLAFGENHRLLRRAESAGFERARYDVVVLIETSTPDAAAKLRQNAGYAQLAERVGAGARRTFQIVAASPRNMGDVDFTRQGVFLFNFFFGEDERELVPVWEYTAGWWSVKTGLDNSRVLAPVDGERRDYGIINHCRWDRLRDVAPNMAFRPSFRRFVLANFAANRISAQPTLYRLA